MNSKQMNRRRSSFKRRTSNVGNAPIQAAPPVQPRTNATMVRRRVSISLQDVESAVTPTPVRKPDTVTATVTEVPKTIDLIKRSESYAFDSSSEEDVDSGDENPPPRALAFGNARYMLQSFESGHWSMAGGRSDTYDSGSTSHLLTSPCPPSHLHLHFHLHILAVC
jgi:hypothetical protein